VFNFFFFEGNISVLLFDLELELFDGLLEGRQKLTVAFAITLLAGTVSLRV